MLQEHDALNEGTVIGGRYRLERPIARGGMGSVWAGRDEKLKRPVALKLMVSAYATSTDARTRFEREAMAVAKLNSPHVVQVYDYGIEGQRPYIVMELLEGEDLRARLRRRKRISLEAAGNIMAQTAKALSEAHAIGIVHRDLKPGNIFMVRQREEKLIKVLDFGVAKIDAAEVLDADTKEGAILGTPQFMAPEQARGVSDVDQRADLWSLGVILFKALTGELPFNGTTAADVIVKICTENAPRATSLAPDLPVELDRFFSRALAREPEKRFPNARQMAMAFGRIAPVSLPSISIPMPRADVAATLRESQRGLPPNVAVRAAPAAIHVHRAQPPPRPSQPGPPPRTTQPGPPPRSSQSCPPPPPPSRQSHPGSPYATPTPSVPLAQTPLAQTPLAQTPLAQTPLAQTPLASRPAAAPSGPVSAPLSSTPSSAVPDSLEQLAPVSDPLSFGDLGTPISISDADATLRVDAVLPNAVLPNAGLPNAVRPEPTEPTSLPEPISEPSSDPAALLRPSNPTLGGGLTEQTPVDPLLLGRPERGGNRTLLLALGAAALGVLIAVVGSVMVRNKATGSTLQQGSEQSAAEDPNADPAAGPESSESSQAEAAKDDSGESASTAEPAEDPPDSETEATPAKSSKPKAGKAAAKPGPGRARPKAKSKPADKPTTPTPTATAQPKDNDPFSERL